MRAPRRASVRAEIGLPLDRTIVAIAGQIAEIKGIGISSTPSRNSRARGDEPSFAVTWSRLRKMAARVRRAMEEQVAALGLSSQVTFLGFRSTPRGSFRRLTSLRSLPRGAAWQRHAGSDGGRTAGGGDARRRHPRDDCRRPNRSIWCRDPIPAALADAIGALVGEPGLLARCPSRRDAAPIRRSAWTFTDGRLQATTIACVHAPLPPPSLRGRPA